MRLLTNVLVLGSCLLAATAQRFALSDLQWSLTNANDSIVVPGRVPSQAHLDLLEAGVITEPLLGANGVYSSLLSRESAIKCIFIFFRFHSAMGRE